MKEAAQAPGSAEVGEVRPDAQREGRRIWIVSLDVIRGAALLGILAVNVQSFGMPDATLWSPTAPGDSRPWNLVLWLVTHILAHEKFIAIFSMLFGAGIVLMSQNAEHRGTSAARLHYRRMAVLAVFGLAHAYLLWAGDVLFSYAMCGSVAFLFRELRPGTLLLVAFCLLTIGSFLYWEYSAPGTSAVRDVVQVFRDAILPVQRSASPKAQMAAYRSGWREQMAARVPSALEVETVDFALVTFWRVTALMLGGMACLKLGAFSDFNNSRANRSAVFAGFAVGVPVAMLGTFVGFSHQWASTSALNIDFELNYWAGLLTCIGWMGAIKEFACRRPAHWISKGLGSMGRMSLTNYLAQTVVCTSIFNGHGLGLFGWIDRIGQFVLVLAIWSAQFCASSIWLKWFSFGPAEWIWRTATYRRAVPMLRRIDRVSDLA